MLMCRPVELAGHGRSITPWPVCRGPRLAGPGRKRPSRKEPAYAASPATACLLGQEEARFWLVLDGDTLYADKNGDGDLTEAGERLTAGGPRVVAAVDTGAAPAGKSPCGGSPGSTRSATSGAGRRAAPAGYGVAGTRRGNARACRCRCGWRGGAHPSCRGGGSASRSPRTGEPPPVLHFDGPLTVAVQGKPRLRRGARPTTNSMSSAGDVLLLGRARAAPDGAARPSGRVLPPGQGAGGDPGRVPGWMEGRC